MQFTAIASWIDSQLMNIFFQSIYIIESVCLFVCLFVCSW